jgi:hypothetical protein
VLTEEKTHDIAACCGHPPRKSHRGLSLNTWISSLKIALFPKNNYNARMQTCLRGYQECVHNKNNREFSVPACSQWKFKLQFAEHQVQRFGWEYVIFAAQLGTWSVRCPAYQAQRYERSFKAMALCAIRTQRSRVIAVVWCVHMHTTRHD